jgi:hypothetical protein
MRKYNIKPYQIAGFKTKGHVFSGLLWPITGSKGDKYSVEMLDNGFTCTCMGFNMYGRCKHIKLIWERLIVDDSDIPQYKWSW